MPKAETTGGLLKGFRLSAGLTQKELAFKLRVKAAHLSEVESGLRRVSVGRAVRWAQLLERPEREFVRSALQEELDAVGVRMTVEVKDGR